LNLRCCLVLSGLLLVAARLDAAETPIPPAPTRWVTDTANFMSPGAVRSLDSQLEGYERSNGHQLIVWIGTTTGDAPIEDWAVRAFQSWKVGRKGLDDGIALFIMSADRRLRIEVGYGLEGQVPDAIASRIINDVIVPRIQAGDPDGAVIAGTDALMRIIAGEALPPQESGRGPRPLTLGQLIVYGIIGLLLLLFFITNPTLAIYILASILSGGNRRRDGWGGGGGGSFGGGGGRSGGGGASGSW
jgi:uncharacterized protein